jgi:hypothetical protein
MEVPSLHVTDVFGAGSEASVLFDVVDAVPPRVGFARDIVDAVLARPGATETPVDISGSVKADDACDPNARIVSDLVPRLPLGLSDVSVLARDAAGNESQGHLQVRVVYDFEGFLPPLYNGGVYAVGRTIAVTFRLKAADGAPVSTAVARLEIFRTALGTQTSVPLTAATFHFTDDLYLSNLSTQGLAPGSYVIRGVLDDGTAHDVAIRLQ